MEQKIEAILFYKNGPVEIKKLASILGVSIEEVRAGLNNLQRSLEDRGVCLILTDAEASLATAPQMTDLIEQLAKDEMSREIGKAGLESLAIILYNKAGISRRRIDYIRGVNSTFILRNLIARGLIERSVAAEDQRTFVYKPTIELLAHLGIKSLDQLPNFESLSPELAQIEESSAEEQI